MLAAAGCESAAGTSSVACEESPGAAGHICTVYSGPGLSQSCLVGTLVPACPEDGVLGVCVSTLSAGGVGESVVATYYTDGGVDVATAARHCATFDGATWVGR